MNACALAIRLKISDNEANTALAALRRLGVPVARLERAVILLFSEARADAASRVMRDETLFNPNKHALEELDGSAPRSGEVWIEELDAEGEASSVRRYVGWRLFGADGIPASPEIVQVAAERLLCNPAIERSILR